MEYEYWSIVNNTIGSLKYYIDGPDWKYKTHVEYAADLPVNKLGSGFPLFENSKSKD